MKLRFLLPLGILVLLVALLAVGLQMDPRKIPSPLVGKPAPAFSLPRLDDPATEFSTTDMLGEVWLLNIWASWCSACRAEHPVFNQWVKEQDVNLIGLDYKDTQEAGLNWLESLGNPYQLSVMDVDGRIGLDWGVYGVPETFVIDKKGIIRYKHIGPVSWDELSKIIRPLIKKLQQEA